MCGPFQEEAQSQSLPDDALKAPTGLTKEILHARGECVPCTFFAFKKDGCRRGDDCEFCHLCDKKMIKHLKQKRRGKKSPIASCNESTDIDTYEDCDSISTPVCLWDKTPEGTPWSTNIHTPFFLDECEQLLDPFDRVKKTISMINAGDIERLCAHASSTLSSDVHLSVPEVNGDDETTSVGEVCLFHRRMHKAMPDLRVDLDEIVEWGPTNTNVLWTATCTATQKCSFLAGFPVDQKICFRLQVSVFDNVDRKPVSLKWSFKNLETPSAKASLPKAPYPAAIDDAESPSGENTKRSAHEQGTCTPCAYFAFKKDGCWKGDSCPYCHLCSKAQSRKREKERSKAFKSAKAKRPAASMAAPSVLAGKGVLQPTVVTFCIMQALP